MEYLAVSSLTIPPSSTIFKRIWAEQLLTDTTNSHSFFFCQNNTSFISKQGGGKLKDKIIIITVTNGKWEKYQSSLAVIKIARQGGSLPALLCSILNPTVLKRHILRHIVESKHICNSGLYLLSTRAVQVAWVMHALHFIGAYRLHFIQMSRLGHGKLRTTVRRSRANISLKTKQLSTKGPQTTVCLWKCSRKCFWFCIWKMYDSSSFNAKLPYTM